MANLRSVKKMEVTAAAREGNDDDDGGGGGGGDNRGSSTYLPTKRALPLGQRYCAFTSVSTVCCCC